MQASASPDVQGHRRTRAAVATAVVGLTGVIIGQVRFGQLHASAVALPLWCGGLVLIAGASALLERRDHSRRPAPGAVQRRVASPRTGWLSARTLVPATISVLCCVMLWYAQQTRPERAGRWDLLVVWVLALSCAFAATWQPRPGHAVNVVSDWWERRRSTLRTLLALGIFGAVPAFLNLATNPWAFTSDEGGFGLVSVAMLDGRLNDPFTVGYYAHPTLYNFLQATAMRLFGRGLFGARFVSAVLGALAVPLAFLVTTRLVGNRRVGLAAAVLLATFHVHLYWTHSALPNGASTFFVLLILYLIDRSLVGGGPAALMGVGIAAGLAQYFYFSNRLLVPVVILVWLVAAVASARATGHLVAAIRTLATRLVLTGAGFMVATTPLIASFVRHPGQFNSRVNSVSLFSEGWLSAQTSLLGISKATFVRDQFITAAMLAFRSSPHATLRGTVPFVGPSLAVAAAVGLVLVTARISSPRWTAIAAVWWFTTIGLALTRGPAETNRWVLCVPLVCVLAAVGGHTVVRLAASQGRVAGSAVQALLAVVVVLTAGVGLRRFFHDANQIEVYSDPNTQTAEHVARDILQIEPDATVYFAGAPRMYYAGFNDLVFRTPHVHSIDVMQPWLESDTPPVLRGPTIFVVLPERSDELRVLSTWFPQGRRHDTLDEHGSVLASMLIVD